MLYLSDAIKAEKMFKDVELKHLLPTFTKAEKHDVESYYAFSKVYEEEITEMFNKEFSKHPVFGPLLKALPKEIQDANNKETDRLLRLGLFENNWEPYIK